MLWCPTMRSRCGPGDGAQGERLMSDVVVLRGGRGVGCRRRRGRAWGRRRLAGCRRRARRWSGARRWWLRSAASDEPAYGISTGFGSLALVRIPADARAELQRALVRSHAAGMGPPVEREVVRAMMLLRARTLAMGCSGARPVVAERILALLGAGLTPFVPEYGSLGASGDLAPLAHCALVLIGEGSVLDGRALWCRRRTRSLAPGSSRSS